MSAEKTVNGSHVPRKVDVPSCIKKGWFSEVEPMWPGQKLSLALEVSVCKQLLDNATQYVGSQNN